MTIDISRAFSALLSALGTFVTMLKNTTVTLGRFSVSAFDIVLTALVVSLVLVWFVPWGGDED